jgi:hypothetical protein
MGISIDEIDYFARAGLLGCRVLDLGAQNLHHADVETMERIAGRSLPRDRLAALTATQFPYVAALYDLLDIEYVSYDVCPGARTMVLDLNYDALPKQHRGYFDLVTNCGTTEHVINQLNCFEIMHDAARPGGILYHQVPTCGYVDHGFFCYHELFFRDLAHANGYEVLDCWHVYRGDMQFDPAAVDMRAPRQPFNRHSGKSDSLPRGPSYNIAVVLRKTTDAPFVLPLEVRTASTPPARRLADRTALRFASTGSLIKEIRRRVLRGLRLRA